MIRNFCRVVLVCLVASTGLAAEQVVWQIGTPDRSYKEFAIPGNYAAYTPRFTAKPVVFEISKSDAAKDWPFIQPGPMDAWAGSSIHPRTIRFNLLQEPRGVFTLRVELVDVQAMAPPTYTITLAGRAGTFQLPPGGGDGSLTNPAAGKPHKIELTLPAELFKKGDNEIVLVCQDGSWVQYDALTLTNDPQGKMPEAQVQSVTAAPTPFFIRRDGKTCRELDVVVGLTAPAADVTLKVEAAGETTETPVKTLAALGPIRQSVGVPDRPEPIDVKVTAKAAGSSKSVSVKVLPQRKWWIYVAASTHTDVGYTDLQPKCAERHNENTDKAIDLCKQYPDFKWNLEVAWQAENYLASRKGRRLEDFLRLAKEGRIGVQVLYANMLTGLCSHEEACRFMQCAYDLHRRYGIPYRSAMISDVPTQEATLPMILANSGIRYFSSGINNGRAPTFTQLYAKSPAWWEGPDGSRVLMMWVPGYAHASGWGLTASVDRARGAILSALRGLEARKDYPYDAVFLHGAEGDNCPLNPNLAAVAKAWNDRYEFPKVVLCHNAEFFEHIEKRFGDKLPVVRGSGGTYWEDGAGSSARETAMCRRAHEDIGNAEKSFALARHIEPKTKYPRKEIDDAWRNCLLYDEHTWGAHCSITQPDSEFTKAQWRIKANFAKDANVQATELAASANRVVASLVRTHGLSLVVMNPTAWTRSDVLCVGMPKDLTVTEPGVVKFERVGDGTSRLVYVLAKDIPARGYRVLRLGPAEKLQGPPTAEGNSIESRLYRVTFDPATGAISSILDKETGRELADPQSPYRLNQYLHVAGGDDTRIVDENRPAAAKLTTSTSGKSMLRRLKLGGLGEMMVFGSSEATGPMFGSMVTVWNDLKRIDIINSVRKPETYKKEAVYFAFPFAAEKPTFRYEVPAGIVCANTDMLPGACLDWFTVQHFVEVEDRNGAIAWATPDAPLACFQDINRGKWQTKLDFTNGHIYSYAMNNYWWTNYLAGQGGDYVFRFAITSRAKADNIASARFGAEVSNPLVADVVEANPNGPLTASSGSLLTVDEPNVMLIGARQAREGEGLVLRLWEITGKETTAQVHLAGPKPKKAAACNLVEAPQGELAIQDGVIAVPIRGKGLATVRVE